MSCEKGELESVNCIITELVQKQYERHKKEAPGLQSSHEMKLSINARMTSNVHEEISTRHHPKRMLCHYVDYMTKLSSLILR